MKTYPSPMAAARAVAAVCQDELPALEASQHPRPPNGALGVTFSRYGPSAFAQNQVPLVVRFYFVMNRMSEVWNCTRASLS